MGQDTRTEWRQVADVLAKGLIQLAAVLALIPLALVLVHSLVNGLPALVEIKSGHLLFHPSFLTNPTYPEDTLPDGGVSNALVGTLIMVGLASAMVIPVGVVAGIYLVEYGHGRWADWVRLSCDVLAGTPSIAAGIFAYVLFVAPLRHPAAWAASFALAVLMLPVITRTTEAAVALIPGSLREAGLALGLRRWRVAFQLILPAALPGVITGCLLAIARAAGETAPVVVTAFGNTFFSTDPGGAMAALPLVVYKEALTPFKDLQQRAWGAVLLLILIVLTINLLSRFALRRQLKFVGKL